MKTTALVLSLILVQFAVGAEMPPASQASPSPSSTLSTSAAPASNAGIIGLVDLRPTYKSTHGSFNTENYAQFGYKFESGNSIYVRQEFNTNLYDPGLSEARSGLNATIVDGSIRAKINNILQDKALGLSFNWEPRLYVPTNPIKRDAGQIAGVRSYFKVRKQFTPTASIQLSDSPIAHFYSQNGALVAGKSVANPLVENRILLEVEFEIPGVQGLSLYIPMEFASVRNRDFSTKAAFNNRWSHKLGVWPELTYPVAKTVRVGLAYRSESFVKGDLSDTSFSDGFKKGVAQVILNASL